MASGALGKPKFVHASYHSNIAPILEGRMKRWWLDFPPGTLPFLHGGAIHLLDALRYVLGEAQEVMCVPVSGGGAAEIGGESFIVAIRFESGTVASITITGTSPGPNRFQISIESDRCAVDDSNQYVRAEGSQEVVCVALPTDDYKDLDRQLEHVIDVADGKATPLNSIDEAYANFRLIAACEASARSGAWTAVGMRAAAEARNG
jgi:predicted dehydrogenase